MGDLKIEAISTPRERKDFVDLAYRLNANDPNWGVNVAAALGVPVTTTLAELNEVPEAT